jgi:hypothetical protein
MQWKRLTNYLAHLLTVNYSSTNEIWSTLEDTPYFFLMYCKNRVVLAMPLTPLLTVNVAPKVISLIKIFQSQIQFE